MDDDIEDWLIGLEPEVNERIVGLIGFKLPSDTEREWREFLVSSLSEIRLREVDQDLYLNTMVGHMYGHDVWEGVEWACRIVTSRHPSLVRNGRTSDTLARILTRFHRRVAKTLRPPRVIEYQDMTPAQQRIADLADEPGEPCPSGLSLDELTTWWRRQIFGK
jgi:hypothetical protein